MKPGGGIYSRIDCNWHLIKDLKWDYLYLQYIKLLLVFYFIIFIMRIYSLDI